MNFIKHLQAAGVPDHYHAAAVNALQGARERAQGLTWAKWKVRLLKPGKIASLLAWHHERLVDVRPDLADWDIAPMVNITAHGDNVPWPGGRPAPGAWLDDTPEARAANYWCKGEHPRSVKSRKAWYRRNAGEYEAWARGMPVDLSAGVQVWRAPGVAVYRCGDAWQIVATMQLVGKLYQRVRVGYEVSNVWSEAKQVQAWYPIAGHDLRAPVTWSVLPAWGAPDA
ncbi:MULTISPECIES: hypothetical protein [unclassified Acidovorax]|uniref:hypothetical protein n=1 Tax=unclassified Acidovorax TaxID=2684926 RepID=UPI001C43F07C|nr:MULTISPECIES: hypothetical protein [unclassified Acidovorax]MBV7427269.1 hypothetical protein [Acidovorax sp. sif0732]MBV7448393.1 hypothetical protein [Acidovorax sp. sif0715]